MERLRQHRTLAIGLLILALFAATALLAPYLPLHDPTAQSLAQNLQPPSLTHPFGQDKLGRDVLSRVVAGARISLFVGTLVIVITVFTGTLLGAVAGFLGGLVDEIVTRIVDIVLAFPGIVLVIGLAAVLGPSLQSTILTLCLTGWTGYARLVRSEVLACRGSDFVHAARALGAPRGRILILHILPQVLAPLLVQATFGLSGIIVAEAGLSFLGLGLGPPAPTWGGLINDARTFLLVAPHLAILPGLALLTLLLGLNLVGEGLRDVLDVRGREA